MTSPLHLNGQRVLVTGASSGIGRATAVLLSSLGAHLTLVGRSAERLNETAATLAGAGHRVAPCDLCHTEAVPAWLAGIAASGPFNGLVHAAGMLSTKPLRFLEPADWSDTLRTNLDSAYALARGFRTPAVSARPAAMVFLSSVAAFHGTPGKSAYAASKGGLNSLVRCLAVELARERIRVNCVAPGWVETEMTRADARNMTGEQLAAVQARHLLGFGQPEDVAHAIAFLLADTGRWITGTTLVVDGGFSCQ